MGATDCRIHGGRRASVCRSLGLVDHGPGVVDGGGGRAGACEGKDGVEVGRGRPLRKGLRKMELAAA